MSKREDWMTDAFMPRGTGKSGADKRVEQPGQHSRELNPHWKSGNSGLPTNNPSPTTVINAWTKMKVKSALETIKRGEQSLEDVANERFGSLEEFCSLCKLCGFSVPQTSSTPGPVKSSRALPPKDSIAEEEKRATANANMLKYLDKRREKEQTAVSKCSFCDCDNIKIVSEADYTFLARPDRPVNSLHLLIIPRQHEESTLDCGPAVLNEIRNYKKTLIRFYQSLDCEPVFVELRRRVGDKRQHVVIECFAIPNTGHAVDTNVYFRKILSDAESYWSTHKPIIECPDGLARALPRRPFPFIHIDLWTESFAHIIEDDRWFPATWPRDNIGKLCDGNDKREHDFAPFDWAVALNAE